MLLLPIIAACGPEAAQPTATPVVAAPTDTAAAPAATATAPEAAGSPTAANQTGTATDTMYSAVDCEYGGLLKSIEAVDDTTSVTSAQPDPGSPRRALRFRRNPSAGT